MAEYLQVFITLPDRKGAEALGRQLLQAKLAACIQVLGPITSHYWWQGKITRSREFLCIVKTSARRYRRLEKMVKHLHPYEIPEIIALPIRTGYPPYLNWLQQELTPPVKRS